MKSIFSKCYDDWGNLKDNALNIAFNLGKKEGLRIGRKQGRADAIEPIKAILEEGYTMMWGEIKTLEKIREQLKNE